MQDFTILPKEIIDSIFEYVPEYGHRVSKEYHEQSLYAEKVSACCDLLRYCARIPIGHIEIVCRAYKSGFPELKEEATRYLKKNLREFLCEYVDEDDEDIVKSHTDILEDIGIKNAKRLDVIYTIDYNGEDVYKDLGVRNKIISLYSLIVLHENGLMTKKEFTESLSEFDDIDLLLEIIFAVFMHRKHIYIAIIRYFPDRVESILERNKNKIAVIEGYIYDDAYYYEEPDDVNYIDIIRGYPKIAGNIDRSILRNVRDHLLGSFREITDIGAFAIQYDEITRIITMITQLADE